jgi:hypothetical protein
LARLDELAEQLPFEVTARPMMDGFVGYADGRTFVSLSPGGLGIKLFASDQERTLSRPGAARLRHAPEDHPSKTYITFSDVDIADDDLMIEWLLLAGRNAPPQKRR